jgi:transcription termination/antitermination protein NusG
VSDEPNNPMPEQVNPEQGIAYTGAPNPAELSAETEGMPISADSSPDEQPPVADAPAPVDESPLPPEEEVVPVETPVAESAEAEPVPAARPTPPPPPAPAPVAKSQEPKSEQMEWYILKVQSNREESIREALLRRVAISGLDHFFGDVIVPTEKVTEFKGGKKRVIKRKLYPGYLVVHMEINDDTWFLVRETPGIGDFTGAAGRPSVMLPHEVQRIVAKAEEKSEKAPKLKIGFSEGERVKIKEGTFENFEGEVESIDQTNGQVTVMINIFGRSTPVTLEYWQIETL